MVDLTALAHECAPSVAYVTLEAVVTHESRAHPFAVAINGGARLTRRPETKDEAVEVAKRLISMGYSIDMGLAQINSANLARLGLTVEQAFDPCTNLRAAETILRGCYDPAAQTHGHGQVALQAALSCYNTGSYVRGLSNGYVATVYRTAKTPQ